MELTSDVEDTQQQQQLHGGGEGGQHFHVLAVDDSHVDRKLLERLLKDSSYEVTCVDSGDKALKFLGLLDDPSNLHAQDGFDNSSAVASASSSPLQPSLQEGTKVNLIMTDYCMPGMSGYDLLRRVKGSYWKDVPVVVMSSENVPSRINMCLEGGADEFLLKPVRLSDLEKLQPYILKSLNNPCEDIEGDSIDDSEDEKIKKNNQKEDNTNKCSTSTNNVAKRKAMSAEPTDRRPKIKGLAVV
ncbi:two-component response regulator ORR9-like isoform X2 [Rhodamnia argentea]|uniref:Two-component response regulator ORR9-like isoform X2 n=1 Tax=Rhodamnia argentea TaxID=178133 RepID=A0A8B8PRD3_9MYRT|nr:two-component response regulator ORR9-like isoform X2 [Rhodamnia argentea]